MKEIHLNQCPLCEGTLLVGAHNQYRIVQTLGHGTFGVTYSAEICRGGKAGGKVCIKEFFVQGISSRDESGNVSTLSDTIPIEQCKAEFIEEAKNLMILNHPNIIKAHEIFETNGTVYYTMDYVEGENLNTYIKCKNISIDEAVSITTKIAYGLSYMHESRHMLHLDLKPGNVMRRSSDGQIFIIDFGLSRYFSEKGTSGTDLPIGLGTKGYAPVEQSEFRNRRDNFKATIDVYALGALFYKLITGETPLPANVYKANPLLLSQKLDEDALPQNIKYVIEKAMQPSPDKRYQSVMDFIYELNAEERKRRKKGFLLTVVVMVAMVLTGYVASNLMEKPKDAKTAYYNNIGNYVFELQEANQGANHYGEIEHYKFLSNGTGFYLFESWHDTSECGDPDCSLEARTDTTTFTYKVIAPDKIQFKKGLSGMCSSLATITLDQDSRQIIVDDEDFPLQLINPEKIDWEGINKILNNQNGM